MPNASHFRITPSTLISRVTEAGSPFIFSVWILPKLRSLLRVDEFNQRVQIAVVGQNTQSTAVSRCNTSDSPLSNKSSFFVCLQLMVADSYDLFVSIDHVMIPGMPCVGCIRVLPGHLDLRESAIEGFPSTLLAGTSCSFRILLLDVFDNPISLGDGLSIRFSVDSWVFISNKTAESVVSGNPATYKIDSNAASTRYMTSNNPAAYKIDSNAASTHYLLYSNQTGEHTIRVYVNDDEFAFSPLTLRVVPPEPSRLSSLTFLQSKDVLVTNQLFQVGLLRCFQVDPNPSLRSRGNPHSRVLLRHRNSRRPRACGSLSLLLFL